MIDCRTQVSLKMEKLTDEEMAWWKHTLSKEGIEEWNADEYNVHVDGRYSYKIDGSDLCIYNEEDFDVGEFIALAQRYFMDLLVDRIIAFTWVETYSQPTAYQGGVVVIDKNSVLMESTTTMMVRMKEEIRIG